MTLQDICQEIAAIEEGMLYGKIPFTVDNLMCAMKPGHPAYLLDDILSELSWDAMEGKEVAPERVKAWVKELKSFRRAFKVKELAAPIRHAEEYLRSQETAVP